MIRILGYRFWAFCTGLYDRWQRASQQRGMAREQSRMHAFQLAELEDRILFNAAPVATVANVQNVNATTAAVSADPSVDASATASTTVSSATTTTDGSASTAKVKMALVDSNLADVKQLVGALDSNTVVLYFDGLKEKAQTVLAKAENWAKENNAQIESLSILSHGQSGSFALGDESISVNSLDKTASSWNSLKSVLTDNAEIGIYGCDVAANDAGKALLEQLATLTGAEIFASNDATGIGGDWILEVGASSDAVLSVQDFQLLNTETAQAWNHYLAPGIVLTPETTMTTTETGGTAQFSVVLNSAISSDVTVTLTYDTTEGTLSSTVLTFTSETWDDAQVITVTGVNDGVADPNITYKITATASSVAQADYQGLMSTISVTNTNNDLNAILWVTTTSDVADGTTSSIEALIANKGADGVISLREAILAANNTENGGGGADRIYFNIANSFADAHGIYAIHPVDTALPYIIDTVVVDASTQSGYAGAPIVMISGTNLSAADENNFGLCLSYRDDEGIQHDSINSSGVPYGSSTVVKTSSGSTLRGFIINGFNTTWQSAAIDIYSNNNTITNCYLGTDYTGLAQGLNGSGIWIDGDYNTVGGTNASNRNVIAGNYNTGVWIDGCYNTLVGNYVGVGKDGTTNLGSGWDTVTSGAFGGHSNTITGNILANVTSGSGVLTFDHDLILGNSIYSNAWMGINYASRGVVANDTGDTDGLQNYPVLTSAISDGSVIRITGTLNSTANTTFRIEFFSNTSGDSSGYGSGKTYLDYVNVTTDASGNASFVALLNKSVSVGNIITATASNVAAYKTSEFSKNATVVVNTAGFTIEPASGLFTSETGLTTNFSVKLNMAPISDVTINVSSGDESEGTVSVTTLTFTSANWNTRQYVTVTPVDDGITDGNQNYNIVLSAATSQDYFYSGLNPADVVVTNVDITGPGIFVTAASNLTVTESGGTASFSIVLNAAPTDNVRVYLSVDDATEGSIDKTYLDFTTENWNVAQIVTVTGIADNFRDGNKAFNVVTSAAVSNDANYSGFNTSDVSITNTDINQYSVIYVDTASDTVDGTTTSLDALFENKGTDGKVSFREALLALNNSLVGSEPDRIYFNIGSGVQTINLNSALPIINHSVILDATTNPGYAGKPLIQLNGTSAGSSANGLVLNVGADGSTIKGFVINRFGNYGIKVLSSGNTIQDNYVGVDPTGLLKKANGWEGIYVKGNNNIIGGSGSHEGNIFSGSRNGVYILGNSNIVQGNYIGVGSDGVTPISNTWVGMILTGGAANNMIGGTETGDGNIISNNGSNVYYGIQLENSAGTGNSILGNSIYGNTKFGINLGSAAAATPNDLGDADTGPNNYQNYPVITSVYTNGSSLVYITGTLNSEANKTYRIELFSNATTDTWGYAQGKNFVGYVNVTTDAQGNASFSTYLNADVDVGYLVSGTATVITNVDTGATGSTSEFGTYSRAIAITQDIVVSPATGLITTADGAQASFGVVLTTKPTGDVTVSISSSDATKGTVNKSSLTFTADNWNVAQTVTIAGGAVGGNYSVVISNSVSTDIFYNGLETDAVSVKNYATGVPVLIVTPTSGLTVNETSGTASFAVSLANVTLTGSDYVTVVLTINDTTEGSFLDGSTTKTLTFTAGESSKTVTVKGKADDFVDGNKAFTVVTSAAESNVAALNGFNTSDVGVTCVDTNAYSVIRVTTISDTADGGDVSSLESLYYHSGTNGISLREAIMAANNTTNGASADRIYFNFDSHLADASGVYVINLTGALPGITDSVIIDGATCTGYNGTPIVQLKGTNAGSSAAGLVLSRFSDGSAIKGLIISDFATNGILVNSDHNLIQGNVICTNHQSGLWITGNSNDVFGNYIGVAADGVTDLGNYWDGITIYNGSNNIIGDYAAGMGNIIAYNGDDGVEVTNTAGTGNRIVGNIFKGNNFGIDLGPNDNHTANHTGTRSYANHMQNAPTITAATLSDENNLKVSGYLSTDANQSYRVDLYATTSSGSTGYGQSERYLGYVIVTTDASGYVSYLLNINTTLAANEYLTALATNLTTYDTSEFAKNYSAILFIVPDSNSNDNNNNNNNNNNPTPKPVLTAAPENKDRETNNWKDENIEKIMGLGAAQLNSMKLAQQNEPGVMNTRGAGLMSVFLVNSGNDSNKNGSGPLDLSLMKTAPAQIRTVSDMEHLFEDLAQKMNNLDSENAWNVDVTTEVATGVAVSLSMGYVMWCLRAGGLMATAFSSLPMWAFIDPLPILEFSEKGAKTEEEEGQTVENKNESLESLLV